MQTIHRFVAQWRERDPPKVEAAGSIPAGASNIERHPAMSDDSGVTVLFRTDDYMADFGTIRIEHWDGQGLILWVGGNICWRSWGNLVKISELKLKVDVTDVIRVIRDELGVSARNGVDLASLIAGAS